LSGTRGFEIVPSVLSEPEIAALRAALRSVAIERGRGGARHLMWHPAVRETAQHSALLAIARRFLAAEPIPFKATLFDKTPRANWLVSWHQDRALPLTARRDVKGWGPWSMKGGIHYAHAPADALSRVVALRLHLDDSCADNGPLRVLPGTHALGVLSDVEIQRLATSVQPIECAAPAGSVVAMRPLLVHASSKATAESPRRVLHIEYADSLHLGCSTLEIV